MDLRQVVRYSAPTREAALARAAEDLAFAAAAGFQPERTAWDDRRVSPTLVVELRYAPPEHLVRRFVLWGWHPDLVVRDAGVMALAGYRAASYRLIAGGGGGRNVSDTLIIEYEYDPDTVGAPVAPIPPEDGDPESEWWPVRADLRTVTVPPDDLARHIPTLRRAFLRLIGAPRFATER